MSTHAEQQRQVDCCQAVLSACAVDARPRLAFFQRWLELSLTARHESIQSIKYDVSNERLTWQNQPNGLVRAASEDVCPLDHQPFWLVRLPVLVPLSQMASSEQ